MPSLDDIPTLPPCTPTGDDLIAVIDGADRRSPKQASLSQLVALGSGLAPTDIALVMGASVTVTKRVTALTLHSGATVTLPSPSGTLRELFIINDVVFGDASLPTLSAGSEAVLPNTSARLLSDGTGWYRVS